MEPFKTCACGRSFSREQWAALELVGSQDDDLVVLELRNCPCRSTLAVPTGLSPQRAHTLGSMMLAALLESLRAKRTRRGWADVVRAWRLVEESATLAGIETDARIARTEGQQAYIRQIIEEATAPTCGGARGGDGDEASPRPPRRRAPQR